MTGADAKKGGFRARLSMSFKSKTPLSNSSGPASRSQSVALPRTSKEVIRDSGRKSHDATGYRHSMQAQESGTFSSYRRSFQIQDSRSSSIPNDSQTGERRDTQTGEIIDHTNLLHSLAQRDSFDSLKDFHEAVAARLKAKPAESTGMAKLPPDIWTRILDYLTLSDVASLALSCKLMQEKLGREHWEALNDPDNHQHKINFLYHLDKHYSSHLLCVVCAKFHFRTQRGEESLKATNISNPLFDCPHAFNEGKKAPRTRLTPGRTLPFTFVQLALRANNHSPEHGISTESLSRRWTHHESGWSHQSRYCIHNGHLLMRVTSQVFAPAGLPPAGMRHLLYSREDFTPYFSVCAHWRDGELMNMCKCALGHIPVRPVWNDERLKQAIKHTLHPPHPIVSLCQDCQPMRRCPECPTEYLIELKLVEDKTDPVNIFKQALVLTRWSDVGDGTSSLTSLEWAACNGDAEYDSFEKLGKRAISGIFESNFNGVTIPGQRILSTNPNKEKLGEKGHNWY